ncbi:MAG: hypothetical protein ABI877_03725, partial [Gemmatimonadaceae bacterium]
ATSPSSGEKFIDHGAGRNARSSSCAALSPISQGRPVVPETAGPGFASFIDPTARVEASERVMIGCRSFVGPFVSLDGTQGPIVIGDGSNLQDNVVIAGKLVVIGDHTTIAHGATIVGPATIGATGGEPAFVGFNSYIDGATVDPGAMVTHLARVAPGVVIHKGHKVLPGKFVRTQAEADSFALGKVAPMNEADMKFMEGVLHVNGEFADGYAEMAHATPSGITGIGRDPGHTDFNPESDSPALAGSGGLRPNFRNRIIGRVSINSSETEVDAKLGKHISIRADEGEPFVFGRIGQIQDRVTFHALEHSNISVGDDVALGYHVVVHGGADDGNLPKATTKIDSGAVLKDWSVVFRSTLGKGSVIGTRAYIDGSQIAPGAVVPDRAIIIKNKQVGTVEW